MSLINDAVDRTIFKRHIPIYEERMSGGNEWRSSKTSVHGFRRICTQNLSEIDEFIDPAVLSRDMRASVAREKSLVKIGSRVL